MIPETAGFPVFCHSCSVQTSTGAKKKHDPDRFFLQRNEIEGSWFPKVPVFKSIERYEIAKTLSYMAKGKSPNHVLRPRNQFGPIQHITKIFENAFPHNRIFHLYYFYIIKNNSKSKLHFNTHPPKNNNNVTNTHVSRPR